MKNETMIKQAIELLQNINPEEVESVQIESFKYGDSSNGFEINITYPSEDVEVVEFYDGNNIKVDESVLKAEGSA